MVDRDFAQFWASQPRFDPFTPAGEPAPVNWCTESKPFADWCVRLLVTLGADPTGAKVAYAKVKLLDHYCRAHAKTNADHRAETNLDNHPCLHQVLLTAWDELLTDTVPAHEFRADAGDFLRVRELTGIQPRRADGPQVGG
jgi:hypothetical protein